MDRILTDQEQSKGKWKKYLYALLIAAVLYIAYLGLRTLLERKVESDDFYITAVEKGDIQNMISASGRVVPAFEREINAPVTTEIAAVIKKTGEKVVKGDLILQLDQEYTRLEFDQLKDELELRKNNILKLELQYDKEVLDMDYRDQIKGLQIEELSAQLSDIKRLFEIGGSTEDDVKEADLQLKVAKIEKKMLENDLAYKRKVNVNEKRNLQLEYTIQEKKLLELRRKLRETDVKSPQKGVITWINEDIGKTVTQGEPLVKIADLEQYKVEATTSDRYAQRLAEGMTVSVRIGNKSLDGYVDRILPEVINNTVKFIVKLSDPSASILRSNLRTEVFLITDKKSDILRLKNGAGIKGAKTQKVFVVRGDKAFKTTIEKGLSNGEYVEIVSGLNQGDRVIISDTEEYDHLTTITLIQK